jgi:hypothetical protein
LPLLENLVRENSTMRFAQSFFLWALLGVLPTLVFFLAWAWRKKHPLIAQFVRSRRRQPPASETPADLRRAGDGAAIRVTCASPQWGLEWEEAKQRGLDIVVALDVSKSMLSGSYNSALAGSPPPDRLIPAATSSSLDISA